MYTLPVEEWKEKTCHRTFGNSRKCIGRECSMFIYTGVGNNQKVNGYCAEVSALVAKVENAK